MAAEFNYTLEYTGTPAIGDTVMFDRPYDGYAGGLVIDLIDGCTGKLLAVRFAPGRTADTHWQRCRPASATERNTILDTLAGLAARG